MNPLRRFRAWLRRDRDIADEVDSHLAMAVEDRVARGQSRTDAERDARREFGNELLVREVTREVRGADHLEAFSRDIRYAVRQIRRTPGFTAVTVLCLALGLGATVAAFSIVNGVLLKPLAYRDPGSLYLARTLPPPSAGVPGNFPINARHFHEWRTNCRSCDSMALVQFQDLTLTGDGDPQKLAGFAVSADLFRTLGVQPALGRDFLPNEGFPGRADIVILTDGLWRSRFGADPAIIGRTVRLNGEQHTVIGVMRPDLHLPKGEEWGAHFGPAAAPALFRPLFIDPSRARPVGNYNYSAVLRIRPDISAQHAAAELNALLAELDRNFKLQTTTILIPLAQQVTGQYDAPLLLLFGAVVAVLLMVCVNVGNLMLVRTAGRYREAGVRMALGSSPAQLLRLVLAEAVVLVTAGGIAGIAIAWAGLRLFVASAPVRLPRTDELQPDWRVFLFAAAAIAACTMLCGLLPALRLSRIDPQESLKSGGSRGTDSGRKLHTRELMVGMEIALCTVLLAVGALLLVSFFRLVSVDRGFETARIVTQDVSYLSPKYARGARRQRIDETVGRLARLPGVDTAAAINVLPLRGDDWFAELDDPHQSSRRAGTRALANFRFVTPGYWQAMGIPLKAGRYLDDSDKDQLRAVVSERAAQHLWPGQNPIGRSIVGVGPTRVTLQVVGVVGEVRAKGLDHDPPMIVYEHFWRMQPVSMSFIARTRPGTETAVAAAIRSELGAMDPEMALVKPWTMAAIVDESVAARRFQTALAVAFAACALLLASLGVYGVISYSVGARTAEMGVRSALGATAAELVRNVVLHGLRPVIPGLIVGLAASVAVGRLIAGQLFGVAPADPAVLGTVAALPVVLGLIACAGPARRAARVDPVRALRFE